MEFYPICINWWFVAQKDAINLRCAVYHSASLVHFPTVFQLFSPAKWDIISAVEDSPRLPSTRAPSRDNALSAHGFSMKWGRAAAAFLRKMDLIYDQKLIVVASIRPLMTRQVAAEYSATALISCFPFTVSVHSKNETHLLYLYLVYDQRKPMKRLTRADPTELFRFMHSIHLQVIKYSLH